MADSFDNEEEINNSEEIELEKNAFISGIDTLEVENIIATRVSKGYRQYLVCFKSWLSEQYLEDYKDLIQEFWKNDDCSVDKDEEEKERKIGNITDNNINYNHSFKKCDNNENLNQNVHDGAIFKKTCYDNGYEFEEQTSNGLLESQSFEKLEKDEHQQLLDSENTSNGSSPKEEKSSNIPLCKKRKLKSLDDIVRKITKTSDAQEPRGEDDWKLSDRLQTLDETLKENEFEVKKEKNQNFMFNKTDGKEQDLKIEENYETYNYNPTKESGFENVNGCKDNVYWSGSKAYHKSENEYSRQKDQYEVAQQQADQPSKSRQRYQKCRFCATLYSDPVLLERHENSHFGYRREHTPKLHQELSPPPLVPISDEHKDFIKDHHREGDCHTDEQYIAPVHSPAGHNLMHNSLHSLSNGNGYKVQSIVRKPIRNLLTKMYESEKQNFENKGQRSPIQESNLVEEESKHLLSDDICPSPEYHQGMSRKNTITHSISEQVESELSKNGRIEGSQDPFRDIDFQCSLCYKIFKQKEALDQHIDKHHIAEKFVCSVCSDVFINKEIYNAHCLLHKVQNYVCGFCKKMFDCRNAYENHLQSHSQQDDQQPFCCHICGQAFPEKTELSHHLIIHANASALYCHICRKGFQRSESLSYHIKTTHPSGNRKNSDNGFDKKERIKEGHLHSPRYQNDRNSSDTREHKSPREMEHSPSRSSSASHDSSEQQRYEPIRMSKHYKEENIYNYEPLTNRHVKTSPRSHTLMHHPHHRNEVAIRQHHTIRKISPNEPYNSTHRMTAVVTDQRSYSPVKPNHVKILPRPNNTHFQPSFECIKCGERFASPSLYDIHMQSHREVFECEKCHKSFTSRNQYDSHAQTHENNKSHKCPFCHRSFSMKGNLRRHIRIHTNEAPYECPICYQRFRRSDGLKGHIKRHETLGESAPTDLLPSQAS